MDDDLRLLDVAIHRFRGFTGEDRPTLRFGNVTVLVGANGHGKTTVFDAIDWAMFGEAWRWAKTNTNADVTRGLRRPDDQQPSVTLRFQNASTHTLARNGPKATWDGKSYDATALCRDPSIFARSPELLRAIRGITYLPQEHLRALVTSESGHQRQLMLSALTGVPFVDRFERNLRLTRDDLESRRQEIDKELSQTKARRAELQLQLKELRARATSNAEILARVAAFLAQPGVDLLTASESVARRIQESKSAEQASATRSQTSRRLARELEEIVATGAELRAALNRASAERDEAKRLLSAAIEAERAALEDQARRSDLLKKLGAAMEGARLSLQSAEKTNNDRRALAAARAAVAASASRLELLTKELATRQQAVDEALRASVAAGAQLEEARAALARATERAALLARRTEVEQRVSKLQQQRAECDASSVRAIKEAREASERESVSRARTAELRARLQQSLEGAERLAQVIAELLGLQPADDPKCLVCGHDHSSGAARANAMRRQLQQAAEVTELTKALAAAEAQLAADATNARSAERREKDANARASKIAEEQGKVVSDLDGVSAQLSEYQEDGVSMDRHAVTVQERSKLASAMRIAVEVAQQNLKTSRAAVDGESESGRRLAADHEALTKATPGDDSANDEERLAQLRQVANRATEELETERRAVETNSALQTNRALDIKRLRQQLSALEASVEAQAKELQRLGDRQSTLLRQIEELGIKISSNTAEIVAALKAAAAHSDDNAGRLRTTTATGEALQGPLATLRASSQIETIERELEDVSATNTALTARSADIQAAKKRLDEIAAAVNKAITDSTTGAIKNAQGRINEILSELCPHQHLNVMRLAKDGALLATDQAGSPTVSPEYYGSTGQLGCMGLAVFLGIALGQRWSRLKMLLLDEPVQNMDDVNFVRFLDLIRRLAETHQVVVSTADKNIGELLRRKLLLWADGPSKTAVIHHFEAFDVERGPRIVTEDLHRLRAVGA